MKVIATAKGYYGQIREPGDVFEVPKGATATWFEEAEDYEPDEDHPAPRADRTAQTHKPKRGEQRDPI